MMAAPPTVPTPFSSWGTFPASASGVPSFPQPLAFGAIPSPTTTSFGFPPVSAPFPAATFPTAPFPGSFGLSFQQAPTGWPSTAPVAAQGQPQASAAPFAPPNLSFNWGGRNTGAAKLKRGLQRESSDEGGDSPPAGKIAKKLDAIHVDENTPVAFSNVQSPFSFPAAAGFGSILSKPAITSSEDMEDVPVVSEVPLAVIPVGSGSLRGPTAQGSGGHSSSDDECDDNVPNWRMGPYYRHYQVSDRAHDERYSRSLARAGLAPTLPSPTPKSVALTLYKPVVPAFTTHVSPGSTPSATAAAQSSPDQGRHHRVKLELIDSPEMEASCVGLETVSSQPLVQEDGIAAYRQQQQKQCNDDDDLDL